MDLLSKERKFSLAVINSFRIYSQTKNEKRLICEYISKFKQIDFGRALHKIRLVLLMFHDFPVQ